MGMSPSRSRLTSLDDPLAQLIHACLLDLLVRKVGKDDGVTPEEVARLAADEVAMDWRHLVRPVRHVATRLSELGRLEILCDGKPTTLREARGEVRLRLRRTP